MTLHSSDPSDNAGHPHHPLKAEGPGPTVSEILRNARIENGDDIAHVSRQLNIRRIFIEAIEEGRMEDLPGMPYGVGFVRTYAKFLKLDSQKLVEQFKQESANSALQAKLTIREPIAVGRTPTGIVIFFSFLLLVISYGGWVYISNKDSDTLTLIPAIPEQFTRFLGDNDTTSIADSVEAVPQADPPATTPTDTISDAVNANPSEAGPKAETKTETGEAETDNTGEERTQIQSDAPSETPVDSSTDRTPPAPLEETVAQALRDTPNETSDQTVRQATQDLTPSVSDTSLTPQPQISSETNEPILNSDNIVSDQASTQNLQVNTAITTQTTPLIPTQEEINSNTNSSAIPDTNNNGTEAIDNSTSNTIAALPNSDNGINPANTTFNPTGFNPTGSDPIGPNRENAPLTPPELEVNEPQIYGTENENARVIIIARGPAWVEVTRPTGEVILTRLLKTGDSYQVPDEEGLSLVTGNAGGLQFVVDGIPAQNIGPIGSVRRDVSLNPAALRSGTANP